MSNLNSISDATKESLLINYHPSTSFGVVSDIILPDFISKDDIPRNQVCFYRIHQLSFDEDYPHREAFENVLLSLDSNAFNFVYILSGSEKGIDLYIGVVKNENQDTKSTGSCLNANDYGSIIEGAFEGNFGGSKIEKVKGDDLNNSILSPEKKYESAGMIVGIPSENLDQKDQGKGFQGMDRLINSMLGLNWRLVVVAEPVSKDEITNWQQEIYRIYDSIAPFAKNSVQLSKNSGSSQSNGTNVSVNKSANYSKSYNTNENNNQQNGDYSHGSSKGTTESNGETSGISNSVTKNKTKNEGQSQSMTAEVINKNAQELLKYIDEELLERVKLGYGRGIFKTSVYYMADNPSTANRLKVSIMSLFQGNASTYSPLAAYGLDLTHSRAAKQAIKSYQNINTLRNLDLPLEQLALLSRPHEKNCLGLNTWLTANEVSLLAGIPQKEIPGICVVEGVDFGLNVNVTGDLPLGYLMQRERKLGQISFALPRNFLNKHTFVAGVTGSGKTTTCHKLLHEAKVPFLVIEPVKTEYRALLKANTLGECLVFTVADEDIAPLRFNPFELVKGEKLSSHIDMLKATFTSAFPMEGSMPQLLEESLYKCYEEKGWNVDTNRNDLCALDEEYQDGDEFTNKYSAFPILNNFLDALKKVVLEKNFDARLRDDYIGTLVSRFSNLRKGAKGRMFNTSHSIDFDKILERNVILELEELKSSEDKALIMGFILTRLSAVIRQKYRKNKNYRHLTLIEEAHRLLSKVEYGDSGSKKSAVEIFTDMLAEVRKYGEGLIIVDQIPNKLASEIIKNTNTKIIHKILARDDKETVGDAMLMDDKQKNYLSALETGQAIIFSEGMSKPVRVEIQKITDTSKDEVPEELIREKYLNYMTQNHQNILLNNLIITNLYSEYDQRLTKVAQLNTESVEIDQEFLDKLNDFAKRHAIINNLTFSDICKQLAQEKAIRIAAAPDYEKILTQFTLRYFAGDSKITPLEPIQLANLQRHLRLSK